MDDTIIFACNPTNPPTERKVTNLGSPNDRLRGSDGGWGVEGLGHHGGGSAAVESLKGGGPFGEDRCSRRRDRSWWFLRGLGRGARQRLGRGGGWGGNDGGLRLLLGRTHRGQG